METKTLKQLKGSEVHSILAAVFEVMEMAQFEPQRDASIMMAQEQKEEQPERWKVVFMKKNTSLDELNMVKRQLGGNFSVGIAAGTKQAALAISIEGRSTEFLGLLARKPFFSQTQQGATQHLTPSKDENG